MELAFGERLNLNLGTTNSIKAWLYFVTMEAQRRWGQKQCHYHSSDRSKETDHKTLRRLAQNREAARKSRLRKKVYTLRNAPYASEEIDVVREQWAKFFTRSRLIELV
ncbi:uncharacterized protein [Spinacia oleracea]|uniref:BZIP domain-containing protein n=1 Tax=Spinacia oleracea TaxID=3562 RepID=A0ABM3QH33_SPIOL|nr:uncharacterized protein LOC110781334 [Spinacia oleracea]